MANKKISELSTRTPSLSDLMLVGDPSSGYSYKCTITSLATIIETDIADGYVTLSTAQTISGAKTFSNNLTLTSVSNAGVDTDKFLVLNGSNVVNFRTGSEVLSDIGGQGALTLTTTGTSGAATLVGNTLNIPQYQAALTNPVTGTGTTNYLSKFTGSTTIGNSLVFDNGTSVGIGTTTPTGSGIEIFNDTIGGRLRLSRDAGTTKGILSFGRNNAGTFQETGRITGTADNASINNGVLTFNTSDSAGNSQVRLTLEADGNVRIATINNATTDTDKFLVSDDGRIKYRTGAEVLSDIGAAASTSISGTTNYIPKFTSSSAIGDSPLYDASGSIGLNSTTPALNGFNREFTVNAGTSGTARAAINIQGSRTSASTFGVLGFYHQTTYVAGIESSRGGDATSGILQFFTSNTTGATERMRLDASGNLGLGTTNPSNKLTVSNGSDVGYLDFNNQSFILGTSTVSGISLFSSSATGVMTFSTNSILRMTLDASGNLGLGVTPANWATITPIQVINASFSGYSNEAHMNANYYYNAGGKYIASDYATRYVQTSGQHLWLTAPSGTAGNAISFTQAMTLTSGGELLINTTSDAGDYKLQVNGNVYVNGTSPLFAGGALELTGNANSVKTFYINRYGVASGSQHRLRAENGYFEIASANSEPIVLTGGNVGIGTTSPAYKITTSGGSSEGAIGIERTTVGTNTVIGALNFTNNNAGTVYGRVRGGRNAAGDGYVSLGTGVGDNLYALEGGNVGIGTTSPTQLLHIFSSTTNVNTRIESTATSGEASVSILGKNSIGTVRSGSFKYDNSDLLRIGTSSAIDFRFETNDIERMRITSGGEVWIANNADQGAYNLQVGGTGVWGAGAYVNGSDIALKENIFDLDGCLDLVKQLKPVTYKYKQSYSRDTSTQTGFIAQDLKELFKDKSYLGGLVKEGGQHLSVAYQNLIPVLAKAIQELEAEIEILKNK